MTDNKNIVNEIHKTSLGYHNVTTTNNYVKGRPGYPTEIIDYIHKTFPQLKPDSLVVDLACGTGKFTEILAGQGGFRNIVGIEPSKEFRDACVEVLENLKLGDSLKYKIIAGTSTSMDLENDSVDCLFIAQAFHWFSNAESLKEISRVLKKDGILFLVWNDMDTKSAEWLTELNEIFHIKYYDGFTPQFRNGKWIEAFKNLDTNIIPIDKNLNLITDSFKINSQTLTHEEIHQRVLSTSYISILPDDKKAMLRKEVQDCLDKTNQSHLVIPYKVTVCWTKKL